jgi:nucleotide-binding universal stress UspA family protein
VTTAGPIHRVVVALDASSPSRAALEAAAALAARHGVELLAVFVEDDELLRYASLPAAREVTMHPWAARRIEPGTMLRSLRAQAARARTDLDAVVRRAKVRASFQVMRGPVAREILAACTESDILFVGRASATRRRGQPLGSTARALVTGCGATVAIFPARPAHTHAVAVLFDGSEGGERALRVAASVADRGADKLVVLLPAASEREGGSEGVEQRAREILTPMGLRATLHPLHAVGIAGLEQEVARTNCALLVLPAGAALFGARALDSIVDEIDCPTLVVH